MVRLSVLPSFSLMYMAFLFYVQVAFKTGDYKQEVIFIGGLTDGFLATEYVHFSWFQVVNILCALRMYCDVNLGSI